MSGERVLLGRITAAHGLKGEVKIASFTATPEDIAAYGPLTDAGGGRPLTLLGVRPFKAGTVIAHVKGVHSREDAEALRGTELYVAREALPPPEDEEFYYSDLIGLTAINPDGGVAGTIIAVHNFGAGDLLEIRPEAGGATQFIPFTKDRVPRVDVPGRTVTVVPPAPDDADGEDGGEGNRDV